MTKAISDNLHELLDEIETYDDEYQAIKGALLRARQEGREDIQAKRDGIQEQISGLESRKVELDAKEKAISGSLAALTVSRGGAAIAEAQRQLAEIVNEKAITDQMIEALKSGTIPDDPEISAKIDKATSEMEAAYNHRCRAFHKVRADVDGILGFMNGPLDRKLEWMNRGRDYNF